MLKHSTKNPKANYYKKNTPASNTADETYTTESNVHFSQIMTSCANNSNSTVKSLGAVRPKPADTKHQTHGRCTRLQACDSKVPFKYMGCRRKRKKLKLQKHSTRTSYFLNQILKSETQSHHERENKEEQPNSATEGCSLTLHKPKAKKSNGIIKLDGDSSICSGENKNIPIKNTNTNKCGSTCSIPASKPVPIVPSNVGASLSTFRYTSRSGSASLVPRAPYQSRGTSYIPRASIMGSHYNRKPRVMSAGYSSSTPQFSKWSSSYRNGFSNKSLGLGFRPTCGRQGRRGYRSGELKNIHAYRNLHQYRHANLIHPQSSEHYSSVDFSKTTARYTKTTVGVKNVESGMHHKRNSSPSNLQQDTWVSLHKEQKLSDFTACVHSVKKDYCETNIETFSSHLEHSQKIQLLDETNVTSNQQISIISREQVVQLSKETGSEKKGGITIKNRIPEPTSKHPELKCEICVIRTLNGNDDKKFKNVTPVKNSVDINTEKQEAIQQPKFNLLQDDHGIARIGVSGEQAPGVASVVDKETVQTEQRREERAKQQTVVPQPWSTRLVSINTSRFYTPLDYFVDKALVFGRTSTENEGKNEGSRPGEGEGKEEIPDQVLEETRDQGGYNATGEVVVTSQTRLPDNEPNERSTFVDSGKIAKLDTKEHSKSGDSSENLRSDYPTRLAPRNTATFVPKKMKYSRSQAVEVDVLKDKQANPAAIELLGFNSFARRISNMTISERKSLDRGKTDTGDSKSPSKLNILKHSLSVAAIKEFGTDLDHRLKYTQSEIQKRSKIASMNNQRQRDDKVFGSSVDPPIASENDIAWLSDEGEEDGDDSSKHSSDRRYTDKKRRASSKDSSFENSMRNETKLSGKWGKQRASHHSRSRTRESVIPTCATVFRRVRRFKVDEKSPSASGTVTPKQEEPWRNVTHKRFTQLMNQARPDSKSPYMIELQPEAQPKLVSFGVKRGTNSNDSLPSKTKSDKADKKEHCPLNVHAQARKLNEKLRGFRQSMLECNRLSVRKSNQSSQAHACTKVPKNPYACPTKPLIDLERAFRGQREKTWPPEDRVLNERYKRFVEEYYRDALVTGRLQNSVDNYNKKTLFRPIGAKSGAWPQASSTLQLKKSLTAM